MRLLEYQAKRLLEEFGVGFSQQIAATSADEAAEAATRLGGPVVIKAQVPFGGRGKAGLVKRVESAEAVRAEAQAMLGREVRGARIERIAVERAVDYRRAFYVGATWDLRERLPVALLGAAGGVDVEQSAPDQIARRTFDPFVGLRAFEGREMAHGLGFSGPTLAGLGRALERIAQALISLDALTVEINPLVELESGELLGLDARVEIDDDAAERQRQRLASLGEIQSTPAGRPATAFEQAAQRIDSVDHRGVAGRLVEFDGDLGLLIGGGGASLLVFDAVRRFGGRPANYCEVGGNPTVEKVAALTELILSKPGVRKLAVIMNVVNNTRADVMAQGVLQGIRAAGREPAETVCLFRIPGSWEAEARELLAAEGVEALGREISLDECARLAVERGAAAAREAGHAV